MIQQTNPPPASSEAPIRELYGRLLEAWNRRQAAEYSVLFTAEGSQVGFDGSTVITRAAIESHVGQVFADHQTGRYVGIVRGVRFLTPDVALLQAVAGVVPYGQNDLNPAINAIQSLVATRDQDGKWHVEHYQNTPAQFHGHPELAEQLTEELRGRL
jgi:uncharacterized protein (TIGR02246 family)